MLTVLAELKVREDKVEEAKQVLRDLAKAVKASEPGTLTYTVHQRKDDPLTFVVYECYQDEGAFNTHLTNLAQHAAGFAGILAGGPQTVFLDPL